MGQFSQQQIFRHPEATSWLSLLHHLLWVQDKKPHKATGDLTVHNAAELRQSYKAAGVEKRSLEHREPVFTHSSLACTLW